MNELTRDFARSYFENKGITYEDITIKELRRLHIELDEEFCKHRKEHSGNRSGGYWVRVNDAKYYKGKYAEDGHVLCAYITAKGTYFSAREVISFNTDGFIGFCGATDNENAKYVLRAFIKWCDWLKQEVEE